MHLCLYNRKLWSNLYNKRRAVFYVFFCVSTRLYNTNKLSDVLQSFFLNMWPMIISALECLHHLIYRFAIQSDCQWCYTAPLKQSPEYLMKFFFIIAGDKSCNNRGRLLYKPLSGEAESTHLTWSERRYQSTPHTGVSLVVRTPITMKTNMKVLLLVGMIAVTMAQDRNTG